MFGQDELHKMGNISLISKEQERKVRFMFTQDCIEEMITRLLNDPMNSSSTTQSDN